MCATSGDRGPLFYLIRETKSTAIPDALNATETKKVTQFTAFDPTPPLFGKHHLTFYPTPIICAPVYVARPATDFEFIYERRFHEEVVRFAHLLCSPFRKSRGCEPGSQSDRYKSACQSR